jgi:hypothetical protein
MAPVWLACPGYKLAAPNLPGCGSQRIRRTDSVDSISGDQFNFLLHDHLQLPVADYRLTEKTK